MYYITIPLKPRMVQISFDDILNDVDLDLNPRNVRNTLTRCVERINPSLVARTNFLAMHNALRAFNEKWKKLHDVEDKKTLYRSFKIPKRSGGLRQIDAPNEELMQALRELKGIFEGRFYASYHSAAFAYVRGRNAVDAVKRHQANKSRWFLKLDLHGFFPSTTPDFLGKMIKCQFPFCKYIEVCGEEELDKALSLCFLNGGLPQGTPISPLLTNMMMIPVDHYIAKWGREHKPHLVYTRYADDMTLSADISFNWQEVSDKIVEILKGFDAPFELNREKTHYGSSAGRNWTLGVMLNANNDITIGHEKKKVFKAMTYQFCDSYCASRPWSVEDTQHFMGLYSYYVMVEPEAIKAIVKKYNEKFKIDAIDAAKQIIKGKA